MDQNHERNAARRDRTQRPGQSVLADKQTFLHPPQANSDQASHDMQEMGQGQAAASARAKSGSRKTGK